MIGPCTLQFQFENNQAGGFIEMTMVLVSMVDGSELTRKTERIFPNTSAVLGPFEAVIQFGEATVSCPLALYLRNFQGDNTNDYTGDTLGTLPEHLFAEPEEQALP